MKRKTINKTLSVLFPVCVAILIITFSIALPIYFRPFYYMQIKPLFLPQITHRSYEEIKAAYDQVLDYLVLPGREFGTGVFAYSEAGAGHFADCKGLFTLNAVALIVSLASTVTIFILNKKGKIELKKPCGLPLWSWAGIFVLGFFALVGGLAAIDFQTAFIVFHAIFFPGKDNWMFDPSEDEVIKIMPEEFFMSCGILILSSIIILSVGLIVAGVLQRKRARKKNQE